MRVSKWGNSLAVRLPASVVDALQLQAGDEIEVLVEDNRKFRVSRDSGRKRAMDRPRKLRKSLPPGFTLDREATHER